MNILNYRYHLYHSRAGKARILLNAVKLFFLMLVRRRFVEKDFFGYKFTLDLKTHGLSKFVFLYTVREVLDTELVLQEVKEHMHVVDLGANIGYYTLLAASRVKDGKVYAFEPDSRNFEVLKKNVETNNLSEKVALYPYAVGNENATGKFYLYKESNINSFVKNPKKEKSRGEAVDVKIIKLDDFEEIDKVDFIRMDIEGYECFVIDGAMEFLKSKKNLKLLIEVHPDVYNEKELNFTKRLEALADLGFRVKYLTSAGVPRPKEIIAKGYEPVKTARELRWERGLYENVSMQDLIEFLRNEKKIVRSILLVKN